MGGEGVAYPTRHVGLVTSLSSVPRFIEVSPSGRRVVLRANIWWLCRTVAHSPGLELNRMIAFSNVSEANFPSVLRRRLIGRASAATTEERMQSYM